MPIVNVLYADSKPAFIADDFRDFVAQKLSCREIQLNKDKISLRVQKVDGRLLSDVEVEVFGHPFPERVKNQDKIAGEIGECLENYILDGKTRVNSFLFLCEMGIGFPE